MRRSAATVIEGNQAVVDEPSLVNSDPEGEGWFFKLTLSDNHELSELMSADQYKSYCEDAVMTRRHGEHRLPLVAGRLCAATPPSCRRWATRCCSCWRRSRAS